MEFAPSKAMIDGEVVAVDGYEKHGHLITVHLQSSASLTFEFDGKDNMIIQVPIVGPMKYARVR